jgi:hypothetical protein
MARNHMVPPHTSLQAGWPEPIGGARDGVSERWNAIGRLDTGAWPNCTTDGSAGAPCLIEGGVARSRRQGRYAPPKGGGRKGGHP